MAESRRIEDENVLANRGKAGDVETGGQRAKTGDARAEAQEAGAKDAGAAAEPYAEFSVEEAFAALDDLIEKLENGEGSLEEAFHYYEEGIKLVKSCNSKIERIEKQVLVLSGEQDEEGDQGIDFS